MPQKNYLLPLHDLPGEGRTIAFEETALWEAPINEFAMNCRLQKPLHATLSVVPSTGGVFVQGTIRGTVILPCNRCAEETEHTLDWSFSDFEGFPGADREESEQSSENLFDPDGESRTFLEHGLPILDMQAILWEEFVLALPPNPLCQETCKGLCPVCGCNRNTEICSCTQDTGDPRLAIFRSMKVTSKKM